MAESDNMVYLGDVDSSFSAKRRRPDEDEATQLSDKKSSPEKRQRTIVDMFSGPQGKKVMFSRSSHRLKHSGGSTSSVKSNATVTTWHATTSGLQKLNAIPFSLSAYQESLSEEEKRLLQLECEVMGKVWLKVLKDEIRKPYFLSLKQFLWKEGVQGIEDTPPTLRVYPAPSAKVHAKHMHIHLDIQSKKSHKSCDFD
ncbi:hypothetical protein BDZ97DRAFT_2073103 [Flammula alnicola]|nr:hypothetical protein BDZ97DRAFT_2073103 [Flammula alnicola]